MATELPKFQELSHLPEQDRLRLLDEFIRELGTYYENVPRFEAREIDIMLGETVGIQVDYPPRGLIVADIRERDDPSTGLGEHWPHKWLYVRDEQGVGQLEITDLSQPDTPDPGDQSVGLDEDVVYSIRVLVVR